MAEKNYIFDDLKGDGNSDQENELYKELLEFEKDTSDGVSKYNINILDFFAVEEKTSQAIIPMRLAAESSEPVSPKQRKSNFLLSSDESLAIKIAKKENGDVNLTLLSNSENEAEEAVLYVSELDKYFISNLKGDFVIGQYSDFDLNKFHFKAVLPFSKIVILKTGNTFSVFSSDKLLTPEITGIKNPFMLLNINYGKDFSYAVLITKKTKDFMKIKNNVIELPLVLLDNKSSLLLY